MKRVNKVETNMNLFPFKYNNNWDKVFKKGLSKICWRQLLKTSKEYGLLCSTNFTLSILEYFKLKYPKYPYSDSYLLQTYLKPW